MIHSLHAASGSSHATAVFGGFVASVEVANCHRKVTNTELFGFQAHIVEYYPWHVLMRFRPYFFRTLSRLQLQFEAQIAVGTMAKRKK
jgi:hypothetical protein